MKWRSARRLEIDALYVRRLFAWLPTVLWPGPGPYGSGGIVVWCEHYYELAFYRAGIALDPDWEVVSRRSTKEELPSIAESNAFQERNADSDAIWFPPRRDVVLASEVIDFDALKQQARLARP